MSAPFSIVGLFRILQLAAHRKSSHVEGMSKEIGADGKVYFDNLSTGLYLIAQKSVTLGDFSPIFPF